MLLSIAFAHAQVTATGVIVDEATGEPVIGASVLEEGTTNGTITDFDGNFQLNVASGAKLVISYVGYKSQNVAAAANLRIKLAEDSEVLDEVVVTGYTTQRKADLTGAVSAVSAKDLEKQQENNPMKALQGKIPGMNISADGNPSGAATVRIRGIGTLNDNDPLYIIDGVPTKSGMHELNPNDIESIQVLKDAASASIYGSRAANGVIIITTKKGAEGKIRVDLDASVAVQSYVNRMRVLNSEQYGRALWQAYINDGVADPNTNVLGYRYDWGYNAQGQPVLNNIMLNKYMDDAGTVPVSNTDWFSETTRPGVIQNYNISVSNGSQKGSSFFSLGYYRNEGVIKNSDFDRFSARINTDYKILKDYVTIGENFTLNRTSEVSAPGGFINSVLQYNPLLPVYKSDGETLAQAPSSSGFPQRENPMSILERNKDNRYTYWRVFGNVFININPVKGLNIRTTAGIDYAQKKQRFFTYPIAEGVVANDKNAVESKQEHWLKWMWNAIITYNLDINKHRADFMLGTELNREIDDWSSAYKEDFIVLSPTYMWPSAGTGKAQAYGGAGSYSLISFFGKANYSYDNRYLVSFTLRHDCAALMVGSMTSSCVLRGVRPVTRIYPLPPVIRSMSPTTA